MTDGRDEEPDPYVIPLSADGTEVLSFDMAEREGWAAYFSSTVMETRAYVLLRIGPEVGPPGQPVVFADGQPRFTFPTNHAERAPLEVRELRVAVPQGSAGFSSSLLREIPFTRIEAAINHPTHRVHLVRRVLPANAISSGSRPGGRRYALTPTPASVQVPDLLIDDPGGYRKPDDFYKQVADRYLALAALSQRPAQELAEANKVPVPTVHRWIREAKARGLLLLPAHRQGAGGERRMALMDQGQAQAFTRGELPLEDVDEVQDHLPPKEGS